MEPDPSKNFILFFQWRTGSLRIWRIGSTTGPEDLGAKQNKKVLEQNKQKNLGATFMGSLKLNKVGTGIEGSVA